MTGFDSISKYAGGKTEWIFLYN